METLKEKYKVTDDKIEVIQPIFQLFYEPTKAVSLAAYALYACRCEGITMSLIQLAVFVLMVVLLVTSAPPVSGGLIVVLTILFTSVGLSQNAILLVISIDTLIDMMRTGFKQIYYAAEIFMVSTKI